jgi:hypothetical protein
MTSKTTVREFINDLIFYLCILFYFGEGFYRFFRRDTNSEYSRLNSENRLLNNNEPPQANNIGGNNV